MKEAVFPTASRRPS